MKVLIAVDGSEIAQKAFNYYFENFHREGNEVLVCYRSEQPDLPTIMFTAGGASFPAEEIAKIMTEHNKKVNDMENQYVMACKNLKAKYKVLFETSAGRPGPGIIKLVEKECVEMIVMGTRGLGVIKRTVMGSVSNYVVHHAKVPVLICPN
uniref:Uncharacterized protein LOC100180855 n=1 Tax=Phallusia mammillata TaxID=59560 RepID=A0A6F9DGM3_9ASCI|nr:uncharacterized protein LOC100180855 [Phallusia mammillata]